jgi:hypothetical protein
MKQTFLAFMAMLIISLVAGCATRPIAPDQMRLVSSDEICIMGEIIFLTGSATYNGHPVRLPVLFNEAKNRGLTCEPEDRYIAIAKYRLHQQQIANQNALLAEQAVVAGIQNGTQQLTSQLQAQQAINAQNEAAYYQQQQANLAAQAQAQRQAQQQQAASLQQGQAQYYQQQQVLNAIKAPTTTTCMDLGAAVSCNTTH